VRLLIVDDDAVFRQELGDLLQEAGHQVLTAPNVPKAIELLEAQDVDVVFTDLKMPRQSGMELLKEVRSRWPRILVVMITGYATVDTAVEAMKVGAFDYVRKPFRLEQVQQVLEMARQEFQFQGERNGVPDVDSVVRAWVGRAQLEVLQVSPRALRPGKGVTVVALDPAEPSRIRDAVEAFVVPRPRVGLVLEGVDRLLQTHRRQDVLEFIGSLRQRMEGKGPFLVTFDPKRVSAHDATDLRAAVVESSTRATLEALSNPLRRAVLRRAAVGPCSFTEAMRAAGLDDSPKLSFHLRKLVEDGLLAHPGEEYRITARGEESIRLLAELDAAASIGLSGNAVIPFPTEPRGGASASGRAPRRGGGPKPHNRPGG
jgi:CheY-like chemotaxis protein